MMKKILCILIGVLIFFVSLEISLRIFNFLFLTKQKKHGTADSVGDNEIRIVFIGDSWTFGSDASPGRGYVDVFSELLKKEFPQKRFQFFNFGYPSYNSSQAVLYFLDNLQKIKPHILVALIGINNKWNREDITKSQKVVNAILIDKKISNIKFINPIYEFINRSKVMKLLRIIYYNLVIKKPSKLLWQKYKSSFAHAFFDIHNNFGADRAREYLIKNYKEIKDYNQFYEFMLYTFGNNFAYTEAFLRLKNLWFPELLKINIRNRKKEYQLNNNTNILAQDIEALKNICDKYGIILILQTYPFTDYVKDINKTIVDTALRLNIYCVDHFEFFLNNNLFNQNTLNLHHPNNKGHFYMGKNLFDFFIQNKILDGLNENKQ